MHFTARIAKDTKMKKKNGPRGRISGSPLGSAKLT